MQRELLDQLISAIGAKMTVIAENIADDKFVGLSQRLEDMRALIAAAENAEKMRGI